MIAHGCQYSMRTLTSLFTVPSLSPTREMLTQIMGASGISGFVLAQGVGINPGITVLTLNLNNLSLGMQTEILRILPWLTALRELTINDIYLADSSQLNAFKVLSRLERLVSNLTSSCTLILQTASRFLVYATGKYVEGGVKVRKKTSSQAKGSNHQLKTGRPDGRIKKLTKWLWLKLYFGFDIVTAIEYSTDVDYLMGHIVPY